MNRTGKVKDDFVDVLPELDTAIEVGGFAGISFHGLTNPYDTLAFRLDVVKDVGGAHESTVITPTIDFGTPLSRTTYVGASLSADFAGGGYADYYYRDRPRPTRWPAGLPVYDRRRRDEELEDRPARRITPCRGDLTHGWSLFGAGSYSHLPGDYQGFADRRRPRQRQPMAWRGRASATPSDDPIKHV